MRQAMSKVEPAVRGCYTVAYSGKEGGNGSLTVDFTVNPNGTVKSASISGSSFGNPTFENCIQKVYEGMTFPKAPGSTAASRPYNFRDASGDVEAEPTSAAK
jgi:TonB family protein